MQVRSLKFVDRQTKVQDNWQLLESNTGSEKYLIGFLKRYQKIVKKVTKSSPQKKQIDSAVNSVKKIKLKS